MVAIVYFYIILLVRGTRAAAVIWGLLLVLLRDIRKGLAQMGAGRFWRKQDFEMAVIDEICTAMDSMARQKIGALLVIQKN
ncbi:diadenylate cyclase CdaA, partial [Aduncisulcus paluster]